jgi:hypothetical protein
LSDHASDEQLTDPPPLALEPDILSRFSNDLRLAGVAGEQRLAKLTYLCLTSRLLKWGKPTNRPVSMIAKGTSSTGKSYTQRAVLRFFPAWAVFDLGSMSKRYLLYSEESLSYRFIVIPEWTSIASDVELVASLRVLLSEGHLVHGTVEGDGKKEARKLEKEGPTGLLMTTTAAAVDSELETRCLSDMTDDSPEQTRRVFEGLAELEDEEESSVHWPSWHGLQAWLENYGESRVVIPYVMAAAKLMPTVATRLRRDFVSMLCLVRAHAILHQASRERDERGRIVATLVDYAIVRDLVGEIVAEGADASVSPAIRETVEAVRDLLEIDGGREYVTMKRIVDKLGIGRTATYDRIRRALMTGYVVNVAPERERGKKIALGAALPGEATFLPTPEQIAALVRSSSAGAPDNSDGSTKLDSDALSDDPACQTKGGDR